MPGRKLIETKRSKRRGPSLLLLAVVGIACLYGGILGWLALTDSHLAGQPVVELALAPETPPADQFLRSNIEPDTDSQPAGEKSATPGATPLTPEEAKKLVRAQSLDKPSPNKLSPDELALLKAAENIRNGETTANANSDDDSSGTGDIRIVGAENVSGDSTDKTDPKTARAEKVKPLPPVPDPALIATSADGPLPIVSKNGRKAWQVYARPLPKDIGKGPRIALVVSGLGISNSATAHAITTLPPEVTLSFAPYGANLQKWITRARDAGHEVLLELPMEPYGYPQNDPGPYTLLTSLKTTDNISRLNWLMSRFTGYVGVMNYQGARFTSDNAALSPVLAALKSRGLMYVDNGASNRSLAPELGHAISLPMVTGAHNIDPVQSPDIIGQSFMALESDAKKSGAAIGVASGFPVTVDAIAAWAPTLAARGITLVPVSATAQ